jgi:3-phenylpropionate/cinnamic acid dioxygenase small subunit
MERWELEARESIRDLVARYNANADSGRFDQVLACFALDAVMELDGTPYRGHDQIRSIFTGAADLARRGPDPVIVRHHTSTLQIDVAGPHQATSRCYYQVLSARGLDHWGRYLDDYGVIGGRWQFVRRREFLDGFVPGSWTQSARSAGDDPPGPRESAPGSARPTSSGAGS